MRTLYKILSLFGDAQSVSKGTYHKRYVRKKAHKGLAGMFKKMKF